MTGPTPDSVTPLNRVTENNNQNNSPSLQDQILSHISSLETLIRQHNKRARTPITLIRLTFTEKGEGSKGKNDNQGLGDERDEDLKRPYKEVLKSSFTRRRIEFSAPNHRMPTNLKIYDGFTEPDDNITRFVARGWFDRMPNGFIDSWTDLRERFAERFALRRKCSKDPTEVSKIIRKANETFLDYKECWTKEMGYIQGVPEVMQISAFMSNSKCPELARRFADQIPRTVTEIMKRVDDFVKSKEAYKSTELSKGENFEKGQGASYKGNRPPRMGHGGGHPRMDKYSWRDHYQPYVPPRAYDQRYNNRMYNNRRQEVNQLSLDSLIKQPKKILATELQLQLPMYPPMTVENEVGFLVIEDFSSICRESALKHQADSFARVSSSAGVKHLIPSCLTRYLNISTGKALVNRSANWYSVLTKNSSTILFDLLFDEVISDVNVLGARMLDRIARDGCGCL
nr:reverse transcriptase domain-containing protein [Tanacetum cinerariifolium]